MSKLLEIGGLPASASAFEARDWIADLIYYDGPFLSLFRGGKGDDVLVLWVDCDKRRDRWASFKVQRGELSAYLQQKVSLKALLDSKEEFIFFHTSGKERKSSFLRLTREEFPSEYMPAEDSFWEESLGTSDALTLIGERTEEYRLGLDGENWYLDDFSKAMGVYRQLYSFHYALSNRSRTTIRGAISRTLSKLAWRGGFSTVNWFNALQSITPAMHRLKVQEIQYASPGHISLEVLPSVASDLASALSKLQDTDARKEVELLYKETYDFLREHGLTSVDARDLTEITAEERRKLEAQGVFAGVKKNLDGFLKIYGISFAKKDLLEAGAEELSLLKAMLSYHRRAAVLADYVADGSLEIVDPGL